MYCVHLAVLILGKTSYCINTHLSPRCLIKSMIHDHCHNRHNQHVWDLLPGCHQPLQKFNEKTHILTFNEWSVGVL